MHANEWTRMLGLGELWCVCTRGKGVEFMIIQFIQVYLSCKKLGLLSWIHNLPSSVTAVHHEKRFNLRRSELVLEFFLFFRSCEFLLLHANVVWNVPWILVNVSVSGRGQKSITVPMGPGDASSGKQLYISTRQTCRWTCEFIFIWCQSTSFFVCSSILFHSA